MQVAQEQGTAVASGGVVGMGPIVEGGPTGVPGTGSGVPGIEGGPSGVAVPGIEGPVCLE